MDPTQGEQNDQAQEKQKQGILGRGINSINNLRGANKLLSNPLGRIGTRVAVQTALRGFSALLASQVGLPILIALASIVILVIIIVGFGGAPGAPPSQTNVQAPIAEPTEATTPTPAAL